MIVFQRILDLGFGLHVDRAGAVIQDQDGGLEQQGAGDGDALFLPAGEVDPALAELGIVALGEG
jgi:hypothetical protein